MDGDSAFGYLNRDADNPVCEDRHQQDCLVHVGIESLILGAHDVAGWRMIGTFLSAGSIHIARSLSLVAGCRVGAKWALLISLRSASRIQCRNHCCASGERNVLSGCDGIRHHGAQRNSANSKSDSSAACRNGWMLAWVRVTCGGQMCVHRLSFVCCNSTASVTILMHSC